MSKAYQCDRCGLLIISTSNLTDDLKIIQHGNTYLDLCCDCAREFDRWWNQEEIYPLQRPKGKWIHWTNDCKDYCECPERGYGSEGEVLLSERTSYCPHCGADMRGGEDENSN